MPHFLKIAPIPIIKILIIKSKDKILFLKMNSNYYLSHLLKISPKQTSKTLVNKNSINQNPKMLLAKLIIP